MYGEKCNQYGLMENNSPGARRAIWNIPARQGPAATPPDKFDREQKTLRAF